MCAPASRPVGSSPCQRAARRVDFDGWGSRISSTTRPMDRLRSAKTILKLFRNQKLAFSDTWRPSSFSRAHTLVLTYRTGCLVSVCSHVPRRFPKVIFRWKKKRGKHERNGHLRITDRNGRNQLVKQGPNPLAIILSCHIAQDERRSQNAQQCRYAGNP